MQLKIYFWQAASLLSEDFKTRQIEFISLVLYKKKSLILLVISSSLSIPLVSPNPGVSIFDIFYYFWLLYYN